MPSGHHSRSPTLPAWYHRVLDYDTVKPEGFDEDLSELGVEEDFNISSDDENCSLGGSEYDYYYELKLQREDRKEELKGMARLGVENRKQEARQFEEQMSNRVKEVFSRVKKQGADNSKEAFVRGRQFGLYSADFVQHGFTGGFVDTMPKNVEFCHYDDVVYGPMPTSFHRPWYDDGEIEGHVCIDGKAYYFDELKSIRRGGLKKLTAKCQKAENGEKLVFQFLDNDHLIMRASRKLAFATPRQGSSSAPRNSRLLRHCTRRGDGSVTHVGLTLISLNALVVHGGVLDGSWQIP